MSWIGQARKRNQRLGAIAYDLGLGVPRTLDLRNSGYLSRVRVTQTLTSTSAATPGGIDLFGQYGGTLSRITLRTNSVGRLFDCSGEMAAIISAIDASYNKKGNLLQTPPTSVAAAATGVLADTWSYDIPVSLNLDNKPWPLGLFQTALNSQETTLEVRYRPVNATSTAATGLGAVSIPGSGIYAGGTTVTFSAISGNTDLQQIYFDPIADPQSQPSLAYIHTWTEWQYPLQIDGDNDFRLPPSNYYTRLIYWVMLVKPDGTQIIAAPVGTVTRLQLRYGANIAPYDETYNAVIKRMYDEYGFSLPLGVLTHDFLAEARNERDIINSAATTDLRFTISTAIGALAAYTGAIGSAYVKVAAEQLIPLVVPTAGTAAVQGQAVTAGV